MKNNSSFKWMEIIEGVLLILLGIFSIIHPRSVLTGVVAVCGIVAVITGIKDIILYIRAGRYTGFAPTVALVTGVLGIMSGFMLLVYPGAGKWIFSLLFPIWFIAHCISGLFRLNVMRFREGKFSYYFTLIVNIAGLVLGFMMFLNPLFSLLSAGYLIGGYLVLLGIDSIIMASGRMENGTKI